MSVINDIKSIFKKYNVNLEVSEEKPETQLMAEGILADGSSIFTDSDTWAVGVRAFVKDAEGNNVPLPDGEYELADGGILKVMAGVVEEIATAKEEAKDIEEETPTPAEAEMSADMQVLYKHIEGLEAEIKALKDKNTTLSSEVTKLSKQPAINSVKDKNSVNFGTNAPASKPFHKMTYEEKVAFNMSKYAKK